MAAAREPDESDDLELLMATSKVLTGIVALSLDGVRASVTPAQLRVLVMLHAQGPLNLTAVAEGLGVNASNASRTCDQLVTGDLVVRSEDRADRRHVVLRLSPKGRRLVARLMAERRSAFAGILEELSPPERRRLARALLDFLRAAEQREVPGATSTDHLLRGLH